MDLKDEMQALAKEITDGPSPEYMEALSTLRELVNGLQKAINVEHLEMALRWAHFRSSELRLSFAVRLSNQVTYEPIFLVDIPDEGYPVVFDPYGTREVVVSCNDRDEIVKAFVEVVRRPERMELLRSFVLRASHL